MEPTYDAVTTLSDTTVPGLYLGEIAPGWTIGKAVNGGVVMAIAATAWSRRLRADGDTSHPDLVSFSGSFLTGSAPGRCGCRPRCCGSGGRSRPVRCR